MNTINPFYLILVFLMLLACKNKEQELSSQNLIVENEKQYNSLKVDCDKVELANKCLNRQNSISVEFFNNEETTFIKIKKLNEIYTHNLNLFFEGLDYKVLMYKSENEYAIVVKLIYEYTNSLLFFLIEENNKINYLEKIDKQNNEGYSNSQEIKLFESEKSLKVEISNKVVLLKKDSINFTDTDSVQENEKITIKGKYSEKFHLQLEAKQNVSAENFSTSEIDINIVDKNENILQKIKYQPSFLMGSSLPIQAISTDDKNFYNGIENYNKIIFGDFNFDDLEDFAFINYEGSNAGPQYTYFLQDKNRKFEINDFLTVNMRFFPKEKDEKNKILTIAHPVGCCQIRTTLIQLINDEWEVVSSEIEDM